MYVLHRSEFMVIIQNIKVSAILGELSLKVCGDVCGDVCGSCTLPYAPNRMSLEMLQFST